MSLKNATVEFQTDIDSFGEGIVIAHDESDGSIVIRDADGIHWRGVEDHIVVLNHAR
ncbi:hypothetical protein Tamer19_13890 [Cupriavidus sp. TA19]|uniref:hypothetical protein n=1 Tax=unclassified Cupriavidus TaxID=2640874 RepID=UPI00272940DD|nr:hypothetical protein [Cupriavidus sp. TA19]GLC91981.1 hypothetical protein Tamer19_13890 [Cupriavidus sp. TA19]